VPTARSQAPIFVIGCHRSGTNLLYDTLLSAGGFAIYRGYLPVYKMLIPRFGNFNRLENRQKVVEAWLHSKGFRRSGLEADFVREKVLNECANGGDFIRITMDEVARRQQAPRWAVYDPDTVLHIPHIKADIPDAIFVHIIRDGRDIALSLTKMGGFRPFPWDRRQRGLRETALYWQWNVRRGRTNGRQFPSDYIEIHFEELVSHPREVLKTLGEFIEHDLDYDRIRKNAFGRVQESNSSFRLEPVEQQTGPVNRWKERLTEPQVAELERSIGGGLQEFGYELATSQQLESGLAERWTQWVYPALLDTKFFLKIRTPLGRLANISTLELDAND
jgi:hypothetical protein